jgi:YHS domain-containing protein
MRRMKNSKLITGIILAAAFAVLPLSIRADDANSTGSADAKAKPDILKTCPVSGDKLGEMGDPYVFVYKGQEVKLCCPNCKKDFDKDPAKYLKKIQEAAAKAQK